MSTANPPPTGPPSNASDLELLRAFEPVVRYTHGEPFLPMDVERYIEASSLWVHRADERDEQIVPEGSLTVDRLAQEPDAAAGSRLYLRFVAPLGFRESAAALREARELLRREDNRFHHGVGRLARGGLLPRLVDGLFSLSLIVRGSVPGATAAKAILKYHELQQQSERYVYHGRVTRQGGWTICQYWFFYAYNNWRSGFRGVNDHESDWEMVTVYAYEVDGRLVPEWAAYASHDFHGADLRRRWDDRVDLELVDGHPVVYAGAGSHASYFKRGEYQAEVPIPVPERLAPVLSALGKLWRQTLGQGGDEESGLRIPFIDFARGDGVSIGPGQDKEWEPVVISEQTPWVGRFRGMWGLFARDPISGENAPGGPMYERDGTPRPSWFDPLGFAELDRVAPPSHELGALQERRAALEVRAAELERLVAAETDELQRRGSVLAGLAGRTHLAAQHARQQERVAEQSAVVRGLLREQVENTAEREALADRIQRARDARADGPQDHIRTPMDPVPPRVMRFRRMTEVWAAISLSGLLVALAAFILFEPRDSWGVLIIILVGFIVVDALLRGVYVRTINRIAVILALIATVVLIVEYEKFAIVAVLVAFAAYLIWQRVREWRA